jgi:Eco57I restriction-modification methylase
VKYTAIRSEGGLLPYDLLDEILAETAPGQKAPDFGLPKGRRVSDEIQRVWLDAQELWSRFKVGREKLSDKDPHGTTLTRDRWIGPILTDPVRLSYDLHFQPSALVLDGLTFTISHRAGEPNDSPPVHIEGCGIELDKRPQKYRVSPQAMVQEFLNRSESLLWGVVTNGLRFRLLRDSVRTARPTYLEFDLETILEGGHYNEFVLFYRLCHRTRLPQAGRPSEDCWLEKYYQLSVEKGGRVRDNLRDGVEEALKVLGTGFLRHPENTDLREKIDSGKLNADQYHRQLLLLVYRLLFLTVAEDRHLVISIGASAVRNQSIYQDNYSIGKLRERAEGLLEDSGFDDLWVGLTQTFKLFADSNDTNPLGIPPLNGDLFSHATIPDLETAQLSNLDLLKAIRWLMFYRERNVRQRVNYAALDVEELGSVYESLLDFRPVILKESDGRKFELGIGSERKTTGSYYTRPELVRELIQSALLPVLEDRLADAERQTKGQSAEVIRNAKSKAILDISVCDPACGSGHFILEAARRLGKELARIRVGEDEPTPEQFHTAVRDVISNCIHGVDQNPLAVDLCKLALWLEGHWAGKPLSFLDHRIRCGNSLIGILDPSVMLDGIPDEAFNPVSGDDKKIAATYKKRNKAERLSGQKRLEFEQAPAEHSEEYAELFGTRLEFPEDKPSDVRRKSELFEKARSGADWWHDWTAANLWTASFFLPLKKLDDPLVPTQETFNSFLVHSKDRPQMTGMANSIAGELRFFHWSLEFPDAFEKGGFDVVLGNPPWERIKLQEQEHWSDDPYISNATNKAQRSERIEEYRRSEDAAKRARIAKFDLAHHAAEATSKFVRGSGRFPLGGVGDINVYAPFAETFLNLLTPTGRAGVILPSGLATDHTTRGLFTTLVSNGLLYSFIEFENEGFFSAGQGHMVRFALTTISRTRSAETTDFVFQAKSIEESRKPERHFRLSSEDISLLNPNTLTCPIFLTMQDALLTKKIYGYCPVLIKENGNGNDNNPWEVQFLAMFHMANDSALFRTVPNLEEIGASRNGTRWTTRNDEVYVPLYEAKMFYLYNHRYADFLEVRGERVHKLPQNSERKLADHGYEATPYYWVPKPEVERRLSEKAWLHGWLIAWRDITDSRASERTVIFSIIPRVGVGHNAPLLLPMKVEGADQACLVANLSSIILDYFARQKVGGLHLTIFVLNQLPVLPPSAYRPTDRDFIVPLVAKLQYTSDDLDAFGSSLGYDQPFDWDSAQREHIRAELDAYYSHLYGLTYSELRFVLDPKGILGDAFPGESFRVLMSREKRELGEYRTGRLVLEAFNRLSLTDRFRGEKRECTITGKTWTVGD